MDDKPKSESWNYDDQAKKPNPQLAEVKQQQMDNATQAYATSLAKEAREDEDIKIEGEQLGKEPWERGYSEPVVGRGPRKGIADYLFLSIFGPSSATDKRFTRTQRAFIRIVLTLVTFFIIGSLWSWLMST